MHNRDWMGFSRTAIAVAVAVVAAAPALAQNTTAGISGRVTGADGKPVAGATVTIVHVESGSSNSVSTDAAGRYGARGLRAGGPYTITVTKDALSDRREGVVLQLAETFSFDSQLGAQAQTIVITGRGVSDKISRSAMGAGTSIGSRELSTFASIQRNLQDYARTDPRLSQTDKERGEISAAGQNTRYNSITIDGVTTNDTFGLESNNLPTAKQPISIDAIQSVQVNLSNYDVTQKGYTGANINAVTKSGTNEFHGSVYYVWRDDSLVGQRYNRVTDTYSDAPAFDESTKGFTFGGPIIKDKLFFFGSYEQFKSSRTSPTYGPIGSSLINVGISPSAITEAISIARNTWGADIGTDVVPTGVELTVKDTLLKLDWNISDAHRANLRYTKTEQTEPFLVGFSATGLSLSSYWYNQDKKIESLVGQWFADWAPNFSTEVKLSQRNYDSQPTPINGVRLPQVSLRFDGALPPDAPAGTSANSRFLTFGTERSRHFNVLSTETLDAYFGATYTTGAHEFKFGADYAKNDVYNAFLQDTNGQYTFRCENGTYSFGAVNCATADAATVQRAVLENFRLGNPSFYQVQAPLPGRTLGDAVATWSYGNTGLFVQDNWKLSPALSLMLGLRVDQQNVPTRPLANTTVAQALVAGSLAGNVVTRNSGGFGLDNTTTLDGNNLLQPRLGFNWDLGSKEHRMQLRGGIGLFQGAAANVWLSNPFSNTGKAVATLSCTSFSACNTAGADFSADPDKQPVLIGTPPAANVDILSTGLEQPSVWKVNLAFETELPALPVVGQLVASAEWLHTKTKSGIFYEHLNLGAATRLGPDGRQMFYTPQGYVGGTAASNYSDSCWTTTGSGLTGGACTGFRNKALSNPNFNNVLLARETSQGGGDALTLSISRPQSEGFGWNFAYTRTMATETSPLTSSVSNSNWANRNIFNPNEEVLSNSNYLVRDRFNASLSWAKAFVGSYRTMVGVFYEGRKGKPYSWTYLNDLNGDGVSGNDLMYIPSAPGSGEVTFRGGATEEARFWEIVNGNPGLASAKGGLVGRNNNYAPWVNNFDVRLSQELPGFMKGHKASFTLDFLNFGNLLNKKWGRISEIGFPSNRSFVNYAGLDASGKYVYSLGSLEDYTTRQNSGESQWALQATLRYEF
ncbi:MAG: TonB-dependent receptor [Rubrivivax sp.]|nr:TonB-dependent receptor [Rubrivivax sp.]